MTEAHKKKIGTSRAENKARREALVKHVYEVKITANKLSQKKVSKLQGCFREAKQGRNYLIGGAIDPFNLKQLPDEIVVYAFNRTTGKCDIPVTRKIEFLGAHLSMAVVQQVQADIINLGKSKKKGRKVGKLRFKSECNSITLNQYGVTYDIKENSVSIQGIGRMRAKGIEQIKGEPAKGWLIKKPSGYYLKVLSYEAPQEVVTDKGNKGLDNGILNFVTDDKGNIPDLTIEFPDAIRQASREVSLKKKGSNNKYKARLVLARKCEKYTNQKDDKVNKYIHELKRYGLVAYQIDNIAYWKLIWGRKLGKVAFGRLKRMIKNLPTAVAISQWIPTTQECPCCYKCNKIPLSERTYRCACGFFEDRDVKAAKTILCYAVYQLAHPLAEYKRLPVEALSDLYSTYDFGPITVQAFAEETGRIVTPGLDASDLSPR